MYPLDEGLFAMKSYHGAFLSARENGGGDILANAFQIGDWETFAFIPADSLTEGFNATNSSKSIRGYLKTFNGSYVTINHEYAN